MEQKKSWAIAVNMGYGHQRTAHPLKDIAFEGKVINANSYKGIAKKDKKIWELSRKFYEFISRFRRFPLAGEAVFSLFNNFQKILNFYPKRDLSKPNFGLKKIFYLIKKGWGRDLIEKLKIENKKLKVNPPLITTFFIPAFMAEVFDYPGEIYCVVCDADIARSWVPLNPLKSKIKYFVPNDWVVNRLKMYGVRKENIILSGYPLPKENIGTEKMEVLKKDLAYRLLNLDPERNYRKKYKELIDEKIGNLPRLSSRPLTILFSIGGAGAQKEIVADFLRGLLEKIKKEEIKIILSAGTRRESKDYFIEKISKLGLKNFLNKNIEIIFEKKISDYFDRFNQKLRKTDILWTKPSELSFYSGLGLPILVAPSIGSQEDFNRKWLLRGIGAGIPQENPRYAGQWIFDYLKSGRFAEAAMRGFIGVEKMGVYNIEKAI